MQETSQSKMLLFFVFLSFFFSSFSSSLYHVVREDLSLCDYYMLTDAPCILMTLLHFVVNGSDTDDRCHLHGNDWRHLFRKVSSNLIYNPRRLLPFFASNANDGIRNREDVPHMHAPPACSTLWIPADVHLMGVTWLCYLQGQC